MRRFFISLALVLGVVTGVSGAVTQPGIGLVKPDVQSPDHGHYDQNIDDQLLIIIVDGRAFEVDGYYIFVYRQKTLMGIFYDIQSPRGLYDEVAVWSKLKNMAEDKTVAMPKSVRKRLAAGKVDISKPNSDNRRYANAFKDKKQGYIHVARHDYTLERKDPNWTVWLVDKMDKISDDDAAKMVLNALIRQALNDARLLAGQYVKKNNILGALLPEGVEIKTTPNIPMGIVIKAGGAVPDDGDIRKAGASNQFAFDRVAFLETSMMAWDILAAPATTIGDVAGKGLETLVGFLPGQELVDKDSFIDSVKPADNKWKGLGEVTYYLGYVKTKAERKKVYDDYFILYRFIQTDMGSEKIVEYGADKMPLQKADIQAYNKQVKDKFLEVSKWEIKK